MQYFWLSIRFWLCHIFLKPLIKTTPLPPSAWDKIDDERRQAELCFIIDSFNAADRIALEHTLHTFSGIPKEQLSFIYLPKNIDALSEEATAKIILTADDKHIMLASVFWGRQADRSNSFFNTYFSQAYGSTTIFRRAITVLLQSRQVNCYISHFACNEISLATLTQAKQKLITLRESVTGPDLSHKRTLITKVTQSKEVRACIKDLVASGEMTQKKAEKKALKLYKEIAADYSYSTLRFLEIVLSFVWKKLYKGIEIHNFDAVNDIAQSHQVIYTPCHRSHIDYLLLSYVIYHQGLMPPHIAAGINLNLPIVGTILRKGGAFFIRREFRGKKLYRSVLESYIGCMIETGVPLEYFVEGGRSRTGLLLPPRPGMLATTVRAAIQPQEQRSNKKPIAIIPVYIGYEKLLESHTYINELYGGQKEKESIRSLFSARKHLMLNYGKVHVNFSEPIYLDDIRKNASPMLSKQALVNHCVDSLSLQIPISINKSSIITPANLVATALLNSNRHALLEDQLKQHIDLLQNICHINQVLDVSKTLSTQENIEHCLSIDFIQSQEKNWGKIYLLDQKGQVNATFLRNNTLHNFIVASIIASVVIKHPYIHKKKIINTCRRLFPFIQSELYLDLDMNSLNEKSQQYLDLFVQLGLLTEENQCYRTHCSESESFYQLSLLAGSSKASIERFYITAQCLLNSPDKHYTQETLETDCIELAQQLALLHTFHAPDFFDKNLFRKFIHQLIKEAILTESKDGLISYRHRLKLSSQLASQVLSKHAQRNINQLANRLTASHR